ncbi:hypothetical protein Rhopal_001761-T1 [Rhodotorula paludigena]|uniref:Aminoglycoside phosphotransferase domain-containing protein n=1 Tax=Rhodotorula paludigena TaxID=86838 RepID=A0AAV5G894_9BASI|nr:hypothetical protein Rhopal_001761-T1 [Rhodotorula paludigena]
MRSRTPLKDVRNRASSHSSARPLPPSSNTGKATTRPRSGAPDPWTPLHRLTASLSSTSRTSPALPSASELPTPQEILDNNVGTVLSRDLFGGVRKTVRRVQLADGRTCVVKHGTEVRREEGEVMRYVRATISVPLPEVLAIRELQNPRRIFLYLEDVQGETLDQALKRLGKHNNEPRRALCAQLEPMLKSLHAVSPPPGTRIGVYDPHREVDQSSRWRVSALTMALPHTPLPDDLDSVPELISWLKSAYGARGGQKVPHYEGDTDREWDERFGRYLDSEAPVVLTHGDITVHNVLVRNNQIVALIDWEHAGWYPSWTDAYVAAAAYDGDFAASRSAFKLGLVLLGYERFVGQRHAWIAVVRAPFSAVKQ